MAGSSYVGKAGHLAFMGELCLRGYNVSMPEIDKGDDIFVVNDATGAMWRVQAKTSRGTKQKTSRRYQFRLRSNQITTAQTPELHYVFIMRKSGGWHFLIMDRAVLRTYVVNQQIGTAAIITLTQHRRRSILTLKAIETGQGGVGCGRDYLSR